MTFFQAPPELGNQYDDDALLQEYLQRTLPADFLESQISEYRELGELGGGELYHEMLADRLNEPVLTPWDAWGNRIDAIEVSPLWKRAEALTVERGLVSAAYENPCGDLSRVHQFTLNYLIQANLDAYSCPLAMSDGAARTLMEADNQDIIERALPHLLSRDPAHFWTSGQWMTERTGGSDVGISETVAVKDGDIWRLSGTKWFTSATTSPMSLALARPVGNGPGGRGLALFYIELRDEQGRMNNIRINRMKDKLGTRKLPTAELSLDGTPARLVCEDNDGVRNISPMLTIARIWNVMGAAWSMRRAIALARDYAQKRIVFGSKLAEKALHQDTFSVMVAESEAVFLLAFRAAELLGKVEAKSASEQEKQLLRMLIPIAKLLTAKQAVDVVTETIECFGGAGYVEDTGLPRLLADVHVLPIWEGTTNVLSLDTLRVLTKDQSSFQAYSAEIRKACENLREEGLLAAAKVALAGLESASRWLMASMNNQDKLEAGARRFAMTLGRCLELSLLCAHAQWVADNRGKSGRAGAAARQFATTGVDLIHDINQKDATLLTYG